jgi:hypothetical protein
MSAEEVKLWMDKLNISRQRLADACFVSKQRLGRVLDVNCTKEWSVRLVAAMREIVLEKVREAEQLIEDGREFLAETAD